MARTRKPISINIEETSEGRFVVSTFDNGEVRKARCRMHGGAKGSGGPLGERNGSFRHGRYTKDSMEIAQSVRNLVREAKALTK